ncbi:hypothetical protein CsatA_010765 [Cannabis sativa]
MARGGRARTRNTRGTVNTSNESNRYSVLGENSRSSTTNDLSNPFFISNGDNPAAVLVPKILTGSENYSTWRRSMMIALVARNKMKFVNGKLPQPDEEHNDYDAWCRCNSTVISWILHAISGEIDDRIMYIDNVTEIWSELYERFNERNTQRIFEAKKVMQNLTQGSSSVTTYFTRLKSLWDHIREYRPQPVCSYGATKVILEYQEEDRLLEFLVELNGSFSNVRSQILMRDPLPTVIQAYASVCLMMLKIHRTTLQESLLMLYNLFDPSIIAHIVQHGKFPNRNAKGPPSKNASANFTGTDEEKNEYTPGDKDLVSSLSNIQCPKLMALLAQKAADKTSPQVSDE